MPRYAHVIGEKEAGRTVKSIVLKEMKLSRSSFSSLKYTWGIRLDGEAVRADAVVRVGQVLTAEWREEGEIALEPCFLSLTIAWSDDNYFIIDKPAPLPTLCSAHQSGPTLENALYAHLGCPHDYVFRPVNRLDKGTSGLLAVARDAHAHQLLQRQLHTDAFLREYRAVCRGALPAAQGVIDLPIGKTGQGIKRQITQDGVRAVTHYWVEEEKGGLSLVRLRLETGRTHQIRVHLSALGCPIVGDYLYGEKDERLPDRFALHACRVRFTHPLTGEKISVESPLPMEIQALMEGAGQE